tara:strand:- start:4185 stop:4424 length:240 start_codon:yes stop_codon:yes gene_type:complete
MTYSLKNSKGAARRVENLKLSDTEVNDLLLTPQGRRTIGNNYVVSTNLPVEIGYDKVGKNYNRSYGPNRAARRYKKNAS